MTLHVVLAAGAVVLGAGVASLLAHEMVHVVQARADGVPNARIHLNPWRDPGVCPGGAFACTDSFPRYDAPGGERDFWWGEPVAQLVHVVLFAVLLFGPGRLVFQ